MFDDGTNGDVTPNNNVFTYFATVAVGTTAGMEVFHLPSTMRRCVQAAVRFL